MKRNTILAAVATAARAAGAAPAAATPHQLSVTWTSLPGGAYACVAHAPGAVSVSVTCNSGGQSSRQTLPGSAAATGGMGADGQACWSATAWYWDGHGTTTSGCTMPPTGTLR